jgi:hypothetical protein
MSRARIAYDFCPLPRRWHAGWANHDTAHARGVRDALFELADGGPIPVHGADWLESLCKQMQFHGRERPNVRKTLKALAAEGLLAWDGSGMVRACFLPGSELLRSVVDRSANVVDRSATRHRVVADRSANEQPLSIPNESSARNDSSHVPQTDRQDRLEETRGEGAAHVSSVQPRPELIGFRWFASLWGRSEMDVPPLHSFLRAHQWIGSRTSDERDQVAQAVQADEWCRANKHMVSPDHLAKFWPKYLGGEAKPVAKADPREASARERVAKLKADYAERIKLARAAGDDYRVCVLEAERDEKVPRMEARLAS